MARRRSSSVCRRRAPLYAAAELLCIPPLPRTVLTLSEKAGRGGPALSYSGCAGKIRISVSLSRRRVERSLCVLSRSVVFHTLLTPWTAAHQPSLSMGFPRQEYWSRLPFPPPGIFPIQGWNSPVLHLLHWQTDSLPGSHLGRPKHAELALKVLLEPDPFSGATTLLSYLWSSDYRSQLLLLPGSLTVWVQGRGITVSRVTWQLCPRGKLLNQRFALSILVARCLTGVDTQ